MNKIQAFIRLIRPKQWVKNIFVFTGVIFGEMQNRHELLLLAFFAALSFCLISSAVYIFNDIMDVEQDRKHPVKKLRPIASGEISYYQALLAMNLFFLLSFALGSNVSLFHQLFLASYLAINVLYTLWLKHVVIIDVFCIASGFMLRILSGTIGIGIPPSKWLLLCGMMITLFLGFTKRKAEILQLKESKQEHRKVLEAYDSGFLDELIGITASAVIMAYSLYTMSEETIRIHHTDNLIMTIPFVVFALFRYIYLTHNKAMAGDPTSAILTDKPIILSVFLWALLTTFLMRTNSFLTI